MSDLQTTPEGRIRSMFIEALGREPQTDEVRRWADAVRSFSTTTDIMSDSSAWTQMAHSMFNTQEFIHFR
jgi:hypothetical protein